jgi:hypothetical protein
VTVCETVERTSYIVVDAESAEKLEQRIQDDGVWSVGEFAGGDEEDVDPHVEIVEATEQAKK